MCIRKLAKLKSTSKTLKKLFRPKKADAHRDDGKRFVVNADEKLTAFVELESAVRLYRRNPRNLRFNNFPVFAKK